MNIKLKRLISLSLAALFIVSGCNGASPNVNLPDEIYTGKTESTSITGKTENTSVSSEQNISENKTSAPTESANPNISQNAETNKPQEENPAHTTGASNSQSGVSVQWKISGQWEEGGSKCGSVELTVINNGAAISGWSVAFAVPDGLEMTNAWNGSFSVNGTRAVASNADYNKDIPSGAAVSAGFNYKAPTSFTPPDNVEFNGQPASSSQNGNNNNGNNGNNGGGNNYNPTPTPSGNIEDMLKRSEKAVQGDDWLFTKGNKIVDKNGKQVWLTGLNWFGYNTGTNTFDGLWNSELVSTVKAIADHGFNLIRVPMSAQLLNQWAAGEYPRANYNNAYNPALNDMNSLQIFDYFLKLAEENGIKVMPDIHSAETDAQGHNVNLWYTDKVSAEDYFHALEWLADRYKDNDTIIAIDLKNEPHGKPYETNKAIWNDSKDANNWKYIAETAAKRIFAKNPNVLIMVEGTEIFPMSQANMDYKSTNEKDYYFNWWGGNLRGVKNYPLDLGKYQNKLVYSPHDYGPTVYKQPWFQGDYDYNSLMKDCWQDNWLYIQKDNIAPLLIGEWGGFMKEPNLKWMTCMRRLIGDYHLNHTFWCLNANSGDTGGLLLDDFITWDNEKYEFVKEVLWQEKGKFVGLDHAIPLGENGITLAKAKGL